MAEATRTNPNSALFWHSRINGIASDLAVRVPETEFVAYDFVESLALVDGEVPSVLPWDEFIAACEDIGWPVFARSDQKSVKHAGPGAYKATEPDDLPTILAVLADYHVKANRNPAALMLREFITIHSRFRAFDGLPIGREFRVFARPTEAVCEHFYWPEDAIESGRETPTTLDGEVELHDDEWRDMLADLNDLGGDDRDRLHTAARDVALALNTASSVADDAAWSVDFAQDQAGDWWLLDAALERDSWHPNCPEVDDGE